MTNPESKTYQAVAESIRALVLQELEEFHRNNKKQEVPTVKNRIGGINLAVEVTGLAKQTIYNKVNKGQIPHYKPNGGRPIFSEAELEEWMKSGKVKSFQERVDQAHQYVARPRRNSSGPKKPSRKKP